MSLRQTILTAGTTRWSSILVVSAAVFQLQIASRSSLEAQQFETPVALTGVTAVPSPGSVIRNATIVLEAGRISAIGVDVAIPANALRIDGEGLWVYAGFVDAASHMGISEDLPGSEEMARLTDREQEVRQGPRTSMQRANRNGIWPHRGVADLYVANDSASVEYREAGFTSALLTPHPAILGGSGDVVQLSGLPLRRSVLARGATQIVSFRAPRPTGGGPRKYPTSIMGSVALLRQTYLDGDWYRRRRSLFRDHPQELRRVEADPVLEAVGSLLDKEQMWLFLANTAAEIHHALDLARELDQRIAILGGKQAWKVADRLREEAVPVVVSLSWDEEPALTVKKPTPGSEESTVQPATITWSREWEDGLFEPAAIRAERLRQWQEEVSNLKALLEAGVKVAVTGRENESPGDLRKSLQTAVDNGLSAEGLLQALTTGPAEILGLEDQLGVIGAGRLANLTVMTGPLEDEASAVRFVFIDGERFIFEVGADKDDEDEDSAQESSPDSEDEQGEPEAGGDLPLWEIETVADRKPPLVTGGDLLLRNARVLTLAPGSSEALEATDVLILDGLISLIGQDLAAPEGTAVVSLDGYWVMPGIVDAHSHMAVTGINEGSQSITSEVRQADVVNHEQLAIHRALAGGVTTIHTMHGSANSMGGQNAVLKLKYNTSPKEMLVTSGPRIVKFALGENVTRTRTTPRYPNTRMGVESVMRQGFNAALEYRADWRRYDAGKVAGRVVELPRRDLRLEALSDILSGDIWVHSHCYRADEILRLLAVAEDYGFRIATLQHVLEGYRVAPEMYNHGVGGSTFSDWWGYKIEAFQAIPYNASMMMRAGIVTSINSDSAELVRHLNLEAAKMIRFGGLTPDEALRLITLNPAIQIGLEERIGSLEIGKDGDLAVFDGHPLDTHARAVLTVIEGEVYYADPVIGLQAAQGEASGDTVTTPFVPTPPRLPMAVARSASGVYAITGATIHPVSEPTITDGVLVLRDGRIETVGADLATPADATIIDASGLHVYPGLIDAASQLSVVEISGIEQTRDFSELARFQPDVRTLSAVNPFSAHVAVARAEGITTVAVLPAGGVISGRAGVIQLRGWSMPEMLRQDNVGLVVDLPSLPANLPSEDRAKKLDEHEGRILEIERYFETAQHYAEVYGGPHADTRRDVRLEAMVPYVRGEKRVFFRADSYKEILEAVRFAEVFGLQAVILGGGEAWKCAELLVEKGIPVVVTTVFNRPSGPFDRFDSYYANPGRLERAGVDFCIAREDRGGNGDVKLLPIHAGMAVAHGLSTERAIRAITLDAARILGLEQSIGSLEPGKVADVIITTGDPTRASTRTLASFIAGEPVELTSLHEENYRKFLARPEPVLEPTGELRGPPPMRIR